MYDVRKEPVKDEKKSLCGSTLCANKAKYRVVFDFVYDEEHQIVLSASWIYICEEHYNRLLITLRRAKKGFEARTLQFT